MARIASQPDTETPIGQAPAFLDMLAHISLVAPLNRPVLVLGERGTGKELVAGRMAYLSPRWDAPFIKLNCAALPDTLLDTELFGHEAGAFTGAQRRRPGRFELADKGTIFLDEIATASPAVQEKLLRVIEYGQFERVGGSETIRVEVRVVAATNVHLPSLAAQGKFRPDLLDRLAFDVVTVPPLRARREDIMLLADYFAKRMTSELQRDYFAGFTPDAANVLTRHNWPGNVRELRTAIEHGVVMSNGAKITLRDLPMAVRQAGKEGAAITGRTVLSAGGDLNLQETEYRLIMRALEDTKGNVTEAAKKLGISRRTLHRKLHNQKSSP